MEALKLTGHLPPETRLYMGQVGGILLPTGLVWLAFATYAFFHGSFPLLRPSRESHPPASFLCLQHNP
ncbi:hypothetical protein FIBSPDRAFT_35470 [Athelia psychrophila]|uniref:Uncharacterized protein n=1 Tax=Athelia psychrophila TaxID=1759441 RepID=A0A166FR59_9AGAM|nr:hypothetical protein FIBSPDRAFT_35470 [Fibularhizoctonia sp. CBS 109695]